MDFDARERVNVPTAAFLTAAVAWAALLLQSRAVVPDHAAHHAAHVGPTSLIVGWPLMLVAMMAPSLVAPVLHVRLRSLKARRARATIVFVAGYASIWIIAGALTMACVLATTSLAPHAYLPAAAGVLTALVWQSSPMKQRCLNRCHAHPPLAAFGAAADTDAFRFGLAQGVWCVGSCWALMLVPMLLPSGHLAAMAGATVLIAAERLEGPKRPAWRMRGLGKAARLVSAQARLRLRAA